MRRTKLLPIAALVGCAPVTFEGDWLGVCAGPEARVQLRAETYDDESRHATVSVHHASHRELVLSLSCTFDVAGDSAGVMGCTGDWEGTDPPPGSDFVLHGVFADADPVPTFTGDCHVEGQDGALELWKIP